MAAAVGKRGGYCDTSWYMAVVPRRSGSAAPARARRRRAEHLGEHEHRRPEHAGQDERERDAQHRPNRPAPSTCEASSSAGSIDFITAPIITKATEPSKRAMTRRSPRAC